MTVVSAATKAWLEDIQRTVYASLGQTLPSGDFADYEDVATDLSARLAEATGVSADLLVEDFREALRDRPSRYEDPMRYRMVAHTVAQVEQILDKVGASAERKVVIGTVPTGRVNAVTLSRSGSDEHVVLVDGGMFVFAHLFGKAFAQCIAPIHGDEGGEPFARFSVEPELVAQHLEQSPQGFRRLGELLFAYAVFGSPSAAEPYIWHGAAAKFADHVRDTMEIFIVGHEYGHVVQSHYAEALDRGDQQVADQVKFSWQEEFASDVFGARVAIQAALDSGWDLPLSFAAVELSLSALELVERTVCILKFGHTVDMVPSVTHPPLKMRRAMLRSFLPQFLAEEDADVATEAITASQHLQSLLEHLWSELEPNFVRMFEAGVALHPMWGEKGTDPQADV